MKTGRYAKCNDPNTWSDYNTSFNRYRSDRSIVGIGLMLSNGLVGIDLDHVIDKTGRIEPWAKEVITRVGSYTEISPSGTGCHILAYGDLPSGANRKGKIEMYANNRYFTITGNVYGGYNTIIQANDAIAYVHRKHIVVSNITAKDRIIPSRSVRVDGEVIISKAMNAANGYKFRTLWHGDIQGYKSNSEAVLALCNYLAFWTGKDAKLMEVLFRKSGLMHLVSQKWDSRRGNSTWGKDQIRKAILNTYKVYNPLYKTKGGYNETRV